MVEESSPLLPPAERSIKAETDTALEPDPEPGELALEPSEPAFVCDCDPQMRSACSGQPFFKEHEGKHFCVLHVPTKAKSLQFAEALRRKVEARDFDFQGVWLPD